MFKIGKDMKLIRIIVVATMLFCPTIKSNAQAYWIYLQAEDLYNGNDSVAPNYERAVSLYEKAAEMGCPMAEEKLSICYDTGKGVAMSKRKAFLWCKKAAKHGVASSQCLLGYYYAVGIGCRPSVSKSYKWYYKAANRGDQDAIETLQSASLYIRRIYVWSEQ